MKRVAFSLLVALGGCNQQAGGEAVTRIDLENPGKSAAAAPPAPTPSVASACSAVTFEDAQLTDCVANPARHTIGTVVAPKGGAPYRSFAALAKAVSTERIAFAVNAGMLDGEGKPIGYYVEDGNRLKELNRDDGAGNFHMKPNGVFFGSGGKWRVMAADAFFATVGDRPQFGTQSGPMLLVDGKLHPEVTDDGPSRTIRNGVGVDGAGRAHFVISEGPVSFGKLARYFRDVVKARDALYLDGSVSALWDPASGRMDARAPIGPMILVQEKPQ